MIPWSFTFTHQRSTRSAPCTPGGLARPPYLIQTTTPLTTAISGRRILPAFVLSSPLATMSPSWRPTFTIVIGHVVWALSVGVATAPHSYTKDIWSSSSTRRCSRRTSGNVLDLGACRSVSLKVLWYLGL